MALNRGASSCKISCPNRQLLIINFTTSQQVIALFYTSLEALPLSKKTMFHVEHTPVQILASTTRRTRQQIKTISANHLQWELFYQLSNAAGGFAGNFDLYFTTQFPLHAQSNRGTWSCLLRRITC